MKYKKVIIFILSVIFFLTALTFYLNRVIFPRLIKKIAIQRIEETIKRRVEIGSIHFNWVKGFIFEKIKIYEKSPSGDVFAQAQQVSFGIIIFPGFKHYRITIPYINVVSPSINLIHTGDGIWNFSDIFSPPQDGTPAAGQGSPAFEIAWGGISISDGKCLVNDVSSPKEWSEFFDNINLKLSLSYKGINYDFTADIPGKKGFVGATVYYQPITKNTQAQIHLKNIDTASYLSLINIPDVQINSGVIKDIDLDINYTQEKTSAQGNVLMKDIDITNNDQTFKGDVELRGLNAEYQNGDIKARGQMALSNIETKVPGLSAGGSMQARVNDFEYTRQGVTFIGFLHAQNVFVALKDRQVQVKAIALDNIKIRKDKDGIQSVGNIVTEGLLVQWPNQRLQGDIQLKAVIMHMKDENNIWLEGDLQADHLLTNTGDKRLSSQHILLEGAQLNIVDQKNIALNTKASLDDMTLDLGNNLLISGSVKTDKILFNLDDNIIKASTILDFSQGKFDLGHHRTIEANPQLELSLQVPLNDASKMTYKGSITLSDAHVQGFAPFGTLENVELDADFQNDEATINALSANILDTNVRINGTVKDFKDPYLDIMAEADELDLAKIKDLAPQLVDQYGLSFNGTSFVKVKFEGLVSDPLAGKVLAVASVKNVSVASRKFHQRIKDITGTLEVTTNSLKWHNFSASYMGQTYSLSGTLEDFKHPRIFTSLDGPDLHLKADLFKNNDLLTINTLKGKYMNAVFDSTGTIAFPARHEPEFIINSSVSMSLEDLVQKLPPDQSRVIQLLKPTGMLSLVADIKGTGLNWKNYIFNASLTSPTVKLMGYRMTDMKISIHQNSGKVKSLILNGNLYDGLVHAVGSLDLTAKGMPYDLAFNINNTDLHKLKIDSPLKMEEIDGKLFLTILAHGTVADFKNTLQGSGSLAIRDGYLAEFNLFKGLLSVLNDALRLGQVEITDVEGNFRIADQKIMTDNFRLKGPTIVLLSKGWVNFDQICDLDMTVDLSSGVVPEVAHDVLNTLNIRIYDKITDPKFKRKISVPQVINSLIKNLLE